MENIDSMENMDSTLIMSFLYSLNGGNQSGGYLTVNQLHGHAATKIDNLFFLFSQIGVVTSYQKKEKNRYYFKLNELKFKSILKLNEEDLMDYIESELFDYIILIEPLETKCL